nr:Rrf2 family transcriptional regulator [Anaerolineae bacterium]
MLEITRQADYALRATLDVAQIPYGDRAPTATIASRQQIPLPFLAKIISQLVVRGVLEATRGASGGVSLARPANTITMLEVIEAIDGPITINRCTRDPAVCDRSGTCPFCEIFTEAQLALVERLSSITIADLVTRSKELESAAAVK